MFIIISGIIGGIILAIYSEIILPLKERKRERLKSYNLMSYGEIIEIDNEPKQSDIDLLESYGQQLESLTTALKLLTESYKQENNTTKKALIMSKIATTQEKINKVNQKQYKLLEKLDL